MGFLTWILQRFIILLDHVVAFSCNQSDFIP